MPNPSHPAERTVGRKGRQPAVFPESLKVLGAYLTTPLPAPTYPIDMTGGLAEDELGMYGNGPDPTLTESFENFPQPELGQTGVGDCFFAGAPHKEHVDAALEGLTPELPTSNQDVGAYLVYDGYEDNGVVMSAAMQHWFSAGFPDPTGALVIPKADAFLRIDPSQIDSALAVFGAVMLGVNLTDQDEQNFSNGQPWTTNGGANPPDPNNGHVVVFCRRQSAGGQGTVISWAMYQLCEADWLAPLDKGGCVEEAWAPVTAEMAQKWNVALDILLADIRAAGGQAIPNPSPSPAPPSTPPPAPAPSPPPAPAPTPAPAPAPPSGIVQEIEQEAEAAVHEVEHLAEEAVEAIEGA